MFSSPPVQPPPQQFAKPFSNGSSSVLGIFKNVVTVETLAAPLAGRNSIGDNVGCISCLKEKHNRSLKPKAQRN